LLLMVAVDHGIAGISYGWVNGKDAHRPKDSAVLAPGNP
jgi:hypothetical protein